ncbi:MAG: acylphosphatase [Chloroflexota bacterium]
MSGDSTTRVRIRIRGKVQGVSFRYCAQQQAVHLGLAGWVRNCPDGAVEAAAQGDAGAVEQFVAWARQGTSGADVDDVTVERLEPQHNEREFRIVH